MKKLVVFGDSFANYHFGNDEYNPSKSWANLVSQKFEIPILNYGISGSSLQFSLHKFFEYYQSKNYNSDDIIIFLLGDSVSRGFAVDMPPHLGVSAAMSKNHYQEKEDIEWLSKNQESFFWSQISLFSEDINFELVQTASVLSVWAKKNVSNKVIVIRNFATKINLKIEKLNKNLNSTKNFYLFLDPKYNLFDISRKEFSSLLSKEHITTYDNRINHFSECNRKVLADIVTDVLLTGDVTLFDINKFHSAIYKTDIDIKILMNLSEPI